MLYILLVSPRPGMSSARSFISLVYPIKYENGGGKALRCGRQRDRDDRIRQAVNAGAQKEGHALGRAALLENGSRIFGSIWR
jgi:hypothetical protein